MGGIHAGQRFGGSLNLYSHRLMLMMDAVYGKNSDGTPVFQQTVAPREGKLRTLAETIPRRLLGLMKRRGTL